MPDIYIVPHSREWFMALEQFDRQLASHTKQILEETGREDVCGVCGSSGWRSAVFSDDDPIVRGLQKDPTSAGPISGSTLSIDIFVIVPFTHRLLEADSGVRCKYPIVGEIRGVHLSRSEAQCP
jgi:hypothetical protein